MHWQDLYLYSRLHPYHRQSQINFDQIDDSSFPRAHYLKPYQVTLQEGDLLYLPPFWFHHVVAPRYNISISINVWSDCQENEITDQLMGMPLPFESDWSSLKTIQATKMFIELLCQLIVKHLPSKRASVLKQVKTGKQYLQQVLIQQRYRMLFKTGTFSSSLPDNLANYCDRFELTSELKEKFNKRADEILKVMVQYHESLRDMFIAHYFEDLAFYALKNVQHVGAFLNECITH